MDKLLDFSELIPAGVKMKVGWRIIIKIKGALIKMMSESALHKFVILGGRGAPILP